MIEAEEIGYIVLKVPVMKVYDPGTFDSSPEEYLQLGDSELVKYQLSDRDIQWLAEHDSYELLEEFGLPTEALSQVAEVARLREEASEPWNPLITAFDTKQRKENG